MPADLRDTEEYRELQELKRLKRQKIADFQVCCWWHNSYFNFRPIENIRNLPILCLFREKRRGVGWRMLGEGAVVVKSYVAIPRVASRQFVLQRLVKWERERKRGCVRTVHLYNFIHTYSCRHNVCTYLMELLDRNYTLMTKGKDITFHVLLCLYLRSSSVTWNTI